MCGIVGHVGNRILFSSKEFEHATDILAHRGPDDRGVYERAGVLLGHRRLSIIDLSDAGRQPLVDSETGAVITFNGEIYNYIELRRQLETLGHRFRTATDTEVLLKSFLAWGEDSLERLNGMWAFAIWLPREKRLFFSRDRFGIKPFYYYVTREGFSFASEPKALVSLFPELRSVNNQALAEFLVDGLLYSSTDSFYGQIKVLPPSHWGEYILGMGTVKIQRYWDYPQESIQDRPLDRALDEFINLFEDAVRIRLRSDVPVGITLSGGLDSSAVLAGCFGTGNKVKGCFTSAYGNSGRGETLWARMACKRYQLTPIEVEAPKDKWLGTLTKIVWHMDGPGYSPAVYPLWFLMKEAKNMGVPVLLEGQGADEALAGYPQYGVLDFIQKCKALFRHLDLAKIPEILTTLKGITRTFTPKWVVLWLMRELFPELVPKYRDRVGAKSVLRKDFLESANLGLRGFSDKRTCNGIDKLPNRLDKVTARLWEDHSKKVLPGLLQYGDAVSMAHSIESRLPFMDYRLVEWVFKQKLETKIRSGVTKWILREYLKINGLEAIAMRPDKKGYPTPADDWMKRENGALLREVLLTPGAPLHEYCEPQRLERLINYHLKGGFGAGNHLYRLLTTELWLEQCIERSFIG